MVVCVQCRHVTLHVPYFFVRLLRLLEHVKWTYINKMSTFGYVRPFYKQKRNVHTNSDKLSLTQIQKDHIPFKMYSTFICTSDENGAVNTQGQGNVYELKISNLTVLDEGTYICQISGDHVIEQKYSLTVNSMMISPCNSLKQWPDSNRDPV